MCISYPKWYDKIVQSHPELMPELLCRWFRIWQRLIFRDKRSIWSTEKYVTRIWQRDPLRWHCYCYPTPSTSRFLYSYKVHEASRKRTTYKGYRKRETLAARSDRRSYIVAVLLYRIDDFLTDQCSCRVPNSFPIRYTDTFTLVSFGEWVSKSRYLMLENAMLCNTCEFSLHCCSGTIYEISGDKL